MGALDHLSPYERRHLVEHLAAAGCRADLLRLLQWEAPPGTNAWFDLKESQAEVPSYLTDLDRASRAVRAHAAPSQAGEFADLIRLILMEASARSRTAQLGPNLTRMLVADGTWSIEQVWAAVATIEDPEQRAAYVKALIDVLPEFVITSALDQWQHEYRRRPTLAPAWITLLVALAPRLSYAQWSGAIGVIERELSERGKVDAFRQVVPFVPPDLIEQMLDDIEDTVETSGELVRFIETAAPFLPAALMPRAYRWVAANADSSRQPFVALLARALELKLEKIPRTAARVKDVRIRSWALAGLSELAALRGDYTTAVDLLGEDLRTQDAKASAVVRLSALLPAAFHGRLIRLARTLTIADLRMKALTTLAHVARDRPSLSTRLLSACRRAVINMSPGPYPKLRERVAVKTIAAIGHARLDRADVAVEMIASALDDLKGERRDDHWNEAISLIVEALGVVCMETGIVRDELLDAIDRVFDDRAGGLLLEPLVGHLTPAQVERILARSKSVEQIAVLARVLTATQLTRLLNDFAPRLLLKYQAPFIDSLAPYLPLPEHARAARFARRIDDTPGRVTALVTHARYCREPRRTAWLTSAMAQLEANVEFEGYRAQAFRDMAPYLDAASLARAIELSESMKFEVHAGKALAALLVRLARLAPSAATLETVRGLRKRFGHALDVQATIEPLLPFLREDDLSWCGHDARCRLADLCTSGKANAAALDQILAYATSPANGDDGDGNDEHDEDDEDDESDDDDRMELLAKLVVAPAPAGDLALSRMRRLWRKYPGISALGLWRASAGDPRLKQEALDLTLKSIDHNPDFNVSHDDLQGTKAAGLAATLGDAEAVRTILAAIEKKGGARAAHFLGGIGPHLSSDHADHALALTRSLPIQYRGIALSGVIVAVSRHDPDTARALLFQLPDYELRNTVPYLCPVRPRWTPLLLEHIEAAGRSETQAHALVALAPFLSPRLAARAMRCVMAIPDNFTRRAPLEALIARLGRMRTHELHRLYFELLQMGAARTQPRARDGLLDDIASLSPIAHRLAGPSGCDAICRGITKVGDWWP